jgi:hypothetical protein
VLPWKIAYCERVLALGIAIGASGLDNEFCVADAAKDSIVSMRLSADSASESDALLASSGTDTDPAADIRSVDTPSGADTAQQQILRVEILPWKLMKPRVMYLCQRRVQNVECLPRKA